MVTLREGLQAASHQLIDEERKANSLERTLLSERTRWENEKLEMQTKANNTLETHTSKTPKVLVY